MSDFKLSCPKFCPLYKSRKKAVLGEGPLDAKLIFIGEAPGREEYLKHRPFVGKAGKLFRRFLKQVDIDDDEIFITNTVLCRPTDERGNNRKPSPKEISCCTLNLQNQLLQLKKPNLAVLLGNVPMKKLLNLQYVTKNRGIICWNEFFKINMIPSYHPSYLLRMENEYSNKELQKRPEFQFFKEDLIKARELSKSRGRIDPMAGCDYRLLMTMAEVKKYLTLLSKQTRAYAVDIETCGLKPQGRGGRNILLIGFSIAENTGFCIPIYHPEAPWTDEQLQTIMKWLKYVLTLPNLKVKQGGKFDWGYIYDEWGFKVRGYKRDTLSGEYMLTRGQRLGLKVQAGLYLGRPDYDSELRQYKAAHGLGPDDNDKVPLKILAPYCCADADVTRHRDRQQQVEPRLREVYPTYSMLTEVGKYLAQMESVGFPVDLKMAKQVDEDLEKTYKSANEKVIKTIGREVNLSSPEQLAQLLFVDLKLPILGRNKPNKKNPKGQPVTDKNVLKELSGQHPLVEVITEGKQAASLRSKFTLPILGDPERKIVSYAERDRRAHCTYNITTTRTGRTSCESPNLQQVARDSRIRDIFCVPEIAYGLKGVDQYYLQGDYCLAKGTQVETVGGSIPIEKIVRLINKGKKVYIYCYDQKKQRIGISPVITGRMTGKDREIWEVILDNGEKVRATPEHKFMLRDGSYKKLCQLRAGDRLMPFYKKDRLRKSGHSYRDIDLNDGRYMKEHNLIAKDVFKVKVGGSHSGLLVHHKDGNGLNNSIENLEVMDRKRHFSIHSKQGWENNSHDHHSGENHWSKTSEGRKRIQENTKRQWARMPKKQKHEICRKISTSASKRIGKLNPMYGKKHSKKTRNLISVKVKGRKNPLLTGSNNPMANPETRRKAADGIREFYASAEGLKVRKRLSERMQGRIPWNKKKVRHEDRNHVVRFVHRFGKSDVYNLTVKTHHNFALAAGIVVKNSQLELRILAHLAGKGKLQKIFLSGEDIHDGVQREVFAFDRDDPYYKEARSATKRVNFSTVYEASMNRVASILMETLPKKQAKEAMRRFGLKWKKSIDARKNYMRLAEAVMDIWYSQFPEVRRYKDRQIEFASENGYVETLFGFRRYLTGINSDDEWVRARDERIAINTPIQSAATHICLLGIRQIHRTKLTKIFTPVVQVHDSIGGIVGEKANLLPAGRHLKQVCEELPTQEFGFTLDIPLVVDIEYGKRWGSVKSLDLN